MNIRALLREHSALATVVVLIILGLAMFLFAGLSGGEGRATNQVYFYDLSAGTVFVASADAVPPIESPASDDAAIGVHAHIFSCGDCPPDLAGRTPEELEAAGAFIGWLGRYPAEARAVLVEQTQNLTDLNAYEAAKHQYQIRAPEEEDSAWMPINSAEATRLKDQPHRRCGGTANRCQPGR